MACPKCGSSVGWSHPTYKKESVRTNSFNGEREIITREWLEFACVTCRYVREEATRDGSR